MDQECQPDAIIRMKLDHLKSEFFEYIEKNTDKIEENIPVFYGQVIATLEKALPEISDDPYDRFIDSITLHLLKASNKGGDISFVEKLFDHAERNRRRKTGRSLYDIVLGITLINAGKYNESVERMNKYRSVDAVICPALAYCSIIRAPPTEGGSSETLPRGPTPYELEAREQMIELIRLNPPVDGLRKMGIGDDPGINRIFWFMMNKAIAWFPENREFFRLGIEKASKDGRRDIREELLGVAVERFFDDMYFLRELYHLKLEKRDAGGVAGVVRQMTQQFPEDPEPVYYGMKLSIITTHADLYYKFRKLALAKNVPRNALVLLDFGFEVMSGRKHEAFACLDEIKMVFGHHHFYVPLLEYAVHDVFSEDEKKVKQAKKVLIDSIDRYCLQLLKITED